MRKKDCISIMMSIVMVCVLLISSYGVAYANGVSPDDFAASQLQGYINGYANNYANFGFTSPSNMEKSTVGSPIHLYRFDQTGVENYVNGNELPLVDNQEWLYPVYGSNNQIENAIRISTNSNGQQYSVFGGFTPEYLTSLFQKYNELTTKADKNSVKVILEESLSTMFFKYDMAGKSFVAPRSFIPNNSGNFQDGTVYDASPVGEKLHAIQASYEVQQNTLRKQHPNELLVGGSGIGVMPINTAPSRRQNILLIALFVLIACIVMGTIFYKKKKSLSTDVA